MCALLLKLGADLNVVSDSGYTPSSVVAGRNGSSEDAAELLSQDAGGQSLTPMLKAGSAHFDIYTAANPCFDKRHDLSR
jgi:hypothetical protein